MLDVLLDCKSRVLHGTYDHDRIGLRVGGIRIHGLYAVVVRLGTM